MKMLNPVAAIYSVIPLGIALTTLGLSAVPAIAQTAPNPSTCVNKVVIGEEETATILPDLNRAKNLARQAAEEINGGLNNYQAEASMYGPAAEAPCVNNGDGTLTFTFQGGEPGFTTPAIESAVTVNTETWQVTVDYNGPIRTVAQDTLTDPERADEEDIVLFRNFAPGLSRAMHLARQAAEKANGGLSQYRAEASMYSLSAETPVVGNDDGTWTFIFKGGAPGFVTPTVESVVTVAQDGSSATVDYNGPIRAQN